MKDEKMPFGKINYIIMAAGVVLIVIGFLLMIGGKPESPEVFNRDVFSFRRITLAPTVVLLGFGVVMFSIFKKPEEEKE